MFIWAPNTIHLNIHLYITMNTDSKVESWYYLAPISSFHLYINRCVTFKFVVFRVAFWSQLVPLLSCYFVHKQRYHIFKTNLKDCSLGSFLWSQLVPLLGCYFVHYQRYQILKTNLKDCSLGRFSLISAGTPG